MRSDTLTRAAGRKVLLAGLLAVMLGSSSCLFDLFKPKSGAASLGKAPDVRFATFDGTSHNLSDYQGKPVVLNFWADWCGPCVAEMPHFAEVNAAYGDRFTLISVSVASAQDPRGYAESNGFKWIFATDSDGSAAAAYEVQAIPTTLFIDGRGRIVDKVTGSMDKAAFEEKVKSLL